jgi:hypothetical protein
MTTIPCRILAAALTSAAFSAGAAPSLAGATTSAPGARIALATAIAHMRPLIHERVNPLNARNGWAILRPNAVSLRKWAAKVADVPADAAQRTSKTDWVSGVRLEARGNLGIAVGLQAKQRDPSLYRTDVVKGRDTLRQANQLVRRAEVSVGLHASSPVYFVYCGRNICPAG